MTAQYVIDFVIGMGLGTAALLILCGIAWLLARYTAIGN